ncbi:MAG: hypothetical protein ACSLFB_14075 [Acidimicrobiales bacterium]
MIPRLSPYQYHQRRITPLSPVGLALFSYSFFIVSTLIPPSAYESILLEQNKMFLNPVVHLFVAACVISFVSGTTIGRKFRFVSRRRQRPPLSRSAIIIPVLLAAAINLLSLTILLRNNPNLLTAWLINAAAAKEELDTAGALSEALPLLFGVSWWSFWRLLDKESLTGKREWTLRLVVGLAFMFAVATSVIKVARYDLMPGVIGFILIYGIYKFKNSSVPIRKYILPLAQAGALVISLFVVISWLRGASNSSDIINNILGYTVASYNRLAAALDGDLNFPFGGTGTYAFRFLDHIPLLDRWLDISEILGTPSSESVWLSEFSAVYQAGLDGRYIWASTFGYLYLDLGLFIFFYLFIVGMLMGWSWKNMLDGGSTGIVIYPWFAFSVLFWFGSNFLAYPRLITFVGAALLLSMYEWMFRIVMQKSMAMPIINRQLWQERL